MAHQYAQIAFTDNVRQVQRELNSRAGYESMDTGEDYNFMFSDNEAAFIAQRDSFYMASVSETDWPYVQHRGGPSGFLKVLDAQTLGFADYKGNRQYVSTGNFLTNDKVSIILMDYPNRRRLKILGRIKQIAEDDWQTLASLEDGHYNARVERGFIIKISAFDWNCPQHITPKYNETELVALISPLQEKIKSLEQADHTTDDQERAESVILGNGELPLVITGIRQLTPEIRAFELRHANKKALPKISAGAHIQVPLLINKQLSWRNYSISSNPDRTDCYEIAVKREDKGSGGSAAIHQQYALGSILHCKTPDNLFPLNHVNKVNTPVVLIAGGIGITAIKSMALSLLQSNTAFELHYAGRTIDDMAYVDRLAKQLGNKLHLYVSQSGKKLSVHELLKRSDKTAHFYLCGPENMIADFKKSAKNLHIKNDNIHYESFSVAISKTAKPCQLTLSQSKVDITVTAEQTLLDAVLQAGIDVPYSCMTGECKSCVVNVESSGTINHQDACLSDAEKVSGQMCLCVSRPTTDKLIINL